MGALTTWAPRLESRLDDLRAAHRVPGAACGVLRGDEVVVAASGVANEATGVEVTPDTLFQIGSITKVYTATLVMQLVEAGLVELETPVRAALTGLRLGDDAATLEVTPHHLLAHTSGIEGDHLSDEGRGADALARYVGTLAEVGQVHAPDELYSYCNSGYGVTGRLVEVVTGESFDQALRRRLLRGLGLACTTTLAEDAILHRVAVGHDQEPGGAPRRQARWNLWRSSTPMGGVLATAADVLGFARFHLQHGQSPDGRDLLSGEAVEAMQEPEVDHPDGRAARGFGWMVTSWSGDPVVGHDGDTLGQQALLRLVPTRGAALVVLTNSDPGAAVADELHRWIAADLFDLDVPPAPAPALAPDPAVASDVVRHVGTYARLHQQVEVAPGGDRGVTLTLRPDDDLRQAGAPEVTIAAEAVDADRFVGTDPRTGLPTVVTFIDPDDTGRSHYLHLGGRAHRRTA